MTTSLPTLISFDWWRGRPVLRTVVTAKLYHITPTIYPEASPLDHHLFICVQVQSEEWRYRYDLWYHTHLPSVVGGGGERVDNGVDENEQQQ